MPLGVVDQVPDGAEEERRVGLQVDVRRLDVQPLGGQSGPLERGGGARGGVEVRRVHRREVEPGAGEKLPHQLVHLEHLPLELGEVRRVGGGEEEVTDHPDVPERSPELVGDRRQQLALVAHLPLDLLRHVVDGGGERADLAQLAPVEPRPAGEPSVAQVARDAGQMDDGARDAPGDPPAREPEDGDRRQHAQGEAPGHAGRMARGADPELATPGHRHGEVGPSAASLPLQDRARRVPELQAELEVAPQRGDHRGAAGRVVPGPVELPAHEAKRAIPLPGPGASIAEEVEDDGHGHAGGEDGGAEPAEDPPVQEPAVVAAVSVTPAPVTPRMPAAHGFTRR